MVPLAVRHPVLTRLRQAGTWWGLRAVLADGPLDAQERSRALDALAQALVVHGDRRGAAQTLRLGAVLDRVDAVGVVAAFVETAARLRQEIAGAGLSAPCVDLLARVDEHVARFLAEGDGAALTDAERAWVELAGVPDFEEAPAQVRVALLCDAAVLHQACFDLTREPATLDHLVAVLQLAVGGYEHLDEELVPPCRLDLDPRLLTVAGRLGLARRDRYELTGAGPASDPRDLQQAQVLALSSVQLSERSSPDLARWMLEVGVVQGYRGADGALDALVAFGDVAGSEPAGSSLKARARALGARAWSMLTGDDAGTGAVADEHVARFVERCSAGEQAAALAGVVDLARAAAALAAGPDGELMASVLLGNALLARADTEGDVADVEEAVTVLDGVVTTGALSDLERAGCLGNLATALRLRAAPGDLLVAEGHARSAEHLATPSPSDLSRARTVLATVLFDADDLDQAIGLWRRARDGADPEEDGVIAYDLASALLRRYERGGPAQDLAEAVPLLTTAYDRLVRRPVEQALCANRLAAGLLAQAQVSGDAALLRASRTWGRRAVQVARASSPETCLRVSWDLGVREESAQAWEEAADAYGTGLEALLRLVGGSPASVHRQARLELAYGMPTRAAVALVRCGRPADAVAALEAGRGLLLADALEAREPVGPAAPDQEPLVYLVPGVRAGVALVLDGSVTALDLPGLTESVLGEQVRAFRAASEAAEDDPATWRSVLERTCAWLAEVLEPVHPGPRLTVVPTGATVFLPVHAVWLDTCVVRFAPTAALLASVRARPPVDLSRASLLAITNPVDSGGALLQSAGPEVALASRGMSRIDLLDGERATLVRTLSSIEGQHVLHAACHGRALTADPRASGLLLAHGQVLTAAALTDLDLRDLRLAVLSACETSVSGAAAPDETMSFGAGLCAAGADGVIGSLWSVPDDATLLLMARFYELWGLGPDPCGALAQAQRWMRDTPAEGKREHWRTADLEEPVLAALLRAVDSSHGGTAREAWAPWAYTGA